MLNATVEADVEAAAATVTAVRAARAAAEAVTDNYNQKGKISFEYFRQHL